MTMNVVVRKLRDRRRVYKNGVDNMWSRVGDECGNGSPLPTRDEVWGIMGRKNSRQYRRVNRGPLCNQRREATSFLTYPLLLAYASKIIRSASISGTPLAKVGWTCPGGINGFIPSPEVAKIGLNN